MSKKLKFKPVVTRVKLNPEQAVLTCDCYDAGQRNYAGSGEVVQGTADHTMCQAGTKTVYKMIASAGGAYSKNINAASS